MKQNKTFKISIFILFIASASMIGSFTFVPVLADPFGVFNYDNPTAVKVQALRAHLFEAHDSAHKANTTEIADHLRMANEDISRAMQNITSGQLPESQNSTLPTVLPSLQKQLSNISSMANTGNMTEVMANLKQADQQLEGQLDDIGYAKSKNSTNA